MLLSTCIHILPYLAKYQLHPHDSKMVTIQVEQKLKVTWRNCFTYSTLKIKFGGLRTRLNTLSVENRTKPGDLTNRSSGPSIVIGRAFVSRQCISSANESTSHLLSVSERVCVCVHVCVCMCVCIHVYMYASMMVFTGANLPLLSRTNLGTNSNLVEKGLISVKNKSQQSHLQHCGYSILLTVQACVHSIQS